MADLSQFIQALYPDRGTPDEPRIMTPESANRPTGRSQQEVDDAFPLLLRAMAAAQQHMVPPMGGSASPVMRGARRPTPSPGGPGWWEHARQVSANDPKNNISLPAGEQPPYPPRTNPSRVEPTIAENDPFRKIVAAKLAAQGGQRGRLPTDPGNLGHADLERMGPAKAAELGWLKGHEGSWQKFTPMSPEESHPYPHQDEVGSTKFLTRPETELQKTIWTLGQAPDPDYPKWGLPGNAQPNRADQIMKARIGKYSTVSDQARGSDTAPPTVSPTAPWAAGSEINKDLLWGPAPTYQGEQWKGTKEDLATLLERMKMIDPTAPPSVAD